MRRLILVCLMLSSVSQAQEISCSARHPAKDIVFDEGSNSLSMIPANQLLLGGGMYGSDPREHAELKGDYQKFKGGYKLLFKFPGNEPKWFACYYGQGGGVVLFHKMKDNYKSCTVEIRNKPDNKVSAKIACK